MTRDELRALQAPLKDTYRSTPDVARTPAHATGRLGPDLTCRVDDTDVPVVAGLHPATGGDGRQDCSADLLLQALVACAGVTLRAVATAMEVEVRDGVVHADATWDARGTLGVDRSAPVGLTSVRLRFELDTDAPDASVAKLIDLTERYCVVLQTLRHGVADTASTWTRRPNPATPHDV